MKKLYTLILALLTIAPASAEELQPFDCEITVTDITPYSATVTLTPASNDEYYIYSCCTKSEYESRGELGLRDYMKSNMDYYIQVYEDNGEKLTYYDFCHQGPETKIYNNLQLTTTYVVFAYAVNGFNGCARSSFKIAEFTTTEDTDEPDTEVTLHFATPKWKNHVADGGWWQITGYTEDSQYWVTLSNSYAVELEDTYTMYDLDMDYTKLYYYVSGQPYEIQARDVTVTLQCDESGDLEVLADYLARNGTLYHFTFAKIPADEVDAILGVKPSDQLATMYNLQGQRIMNTQKGIIIRGGKKYMKR